MDGACKEQQVGDRHNSVEYKDEFRTMISSGVFASSLEQVREAPISFKTYAKKSHANQSQIRVSILYNKTKVALQRKEEQDMVLGEG